ncbi:hypothetical protein Ciccas_005908 [Cichlidogyrus casuarinus]|uniref:PDZ domain-containing protein n=1 Tax=Cichlidogyrus casuarinus TaxID=1844966 RepID=A0ABD2Q9Q6_9PLAT
MSLYPTLEDLMVDDILTAQEQEELKNSRNLYPNLGFDSNKITEKVEASFVGVQMRHYFDENGQIVFSEPASVEPDKTLQNMLDKDKIVALDHSASHTTARAVAIKEADAYEIKHGVRKLILCKDQKGKIGIQCRSIDTGVFVSFVQAESPAAKVGLKFGDQILEFNNNYLAGKSESEIGKYIEKAPINGIEVIVRDRPFERTTSLFKDSQGKLGFTVKNGCIQDLVKDSSAARNGVLTNHQLVELNGVNVIGIDDKTMLRMLETVPQKVTITTMPKHLFSILIKKLGSSQLKKEMDRSVPEF